MPSTKKRTFGKYKVDKVLGRGASGTVFKAVDPMMGRDVAIKLLHATEDELHVEEGVSSRDRFLCEAKAYGRLRHPNIVSCYACDELRGDLLLVMEYVDGVTLKEMFDRREPVEQDRAVAIILQILDALSYAHQKGVVHRDIKPSNIMIDSDGHVKIADFGIARLDATDLTRTGMVLGSPGYMSPEQFMGRKVDLRTDIFSVAVIFYQLITGCMPFKGSDLGEILHKVLYEQPDCPAQVNTSCSQVLSDVIMKGLSKKAEQRFSSAAEFISGVEKASLPETNTASEIDMTILDGQASQQGQLIGQPWHLSKGGIVAVASAGVVSLLTLFMYQPVSENTANKVLQAKESPPSDIQAVMGAIGGDEVTQVAAEKQSLLYSSINGLVSQLACVESDVKLHYSDIGYQVDMQGYYSSEKDLDLVTSKVAKLPGVVSVNNQMIPGISPYCDAVKFLESTASHQNILLKPSDAIAAAFSEGERLTVGFNTLNTPLYYYVDYFLMDGSVVHLNATDSASVIPLKPHQTFRIGGDKSSSQWEVTAPYGLEMVSVVATNKPLAEMLSSVSTSSVEYLEQLSGRIKDSEASLVLSDYMYIQTQEK